jgi:hypothetical protein
MRLRFAASLTLALISAVILLYTGLWLGSRPRTCAVVDSSQGSVVVCSNDWAERVSQ